MKTILRTSAIASLAVVACVFAAPAAAQITKKPINPIPTPTPPGAGGLVSFCPTPSLAVCRSEGYLATSCAKKPSNEAQCKALFEAEYKAQYAGSSVPESTVFTPPGTDKPMSVQVGRRVAFDPLALKASPKDDTTFAGMQPIFSTDSASTDPIGVVKIPKVYVRHPTFVSNGTIASCGEYVWEKYYDYSRFEDSARLCGSDLECVYDVAYNRVAPQPNGNIPTPGALAIVVTPGIAYRSDLRRLDGTVMDKIGLYGPGDGITGGKLPKNAFFTTPTAFLKKMALSGPPSVRPLYLAIAARLETGASYDIGPGSAYKDEWSWHEAMHDAQTPLEITPGERIAIDWRLARITRLLQEYWSAVIAEELGSTPVPIFDPVGSLTKLPGAEIFTAQDPFFFLTSLQSMQAKVAPATITSALAVKSTAFEFDASSVASFLSALSAGPDALNVQPMSLDIGGGAKIKVGNVALPHKLTAGVGNQSIGERLAAALVEEWIRPDGCLGNHNRCDWSPRMFANRFLDLFQYERERDLDRCLDATPPKFAAAGAANGAAPTAAERTSIAALEGYFTRRATQYGEQLKDVPVLPPSAGGLPRIGKSWVGGNDFGFPDFLGARYSYDVGWDIAAEKLDTDGNICRLGARANATLKAHVTYPQLAWPPIKTETIVDTDSYVEIRNGGAKVHSHFAILGKDLYTSFTETVTPDAPKPIPATSQEQVLIELKKTVIIMGVPVTGALKATASVGFSGILGAEAPAKDGCDKNNLATKLKAEFVPSGEARAKAYLMIGIPGIGAGVEGELLIVRAEVPANASVFMSAEGQQTFLGFHADAALKLHSLSGRVEAYAELCVPLLRCYRTSTELFAWDGYHQTYPLVNLDKKVELFALRNAKPTTP